jgi:nitrogen regulatory protein PII
MKEIKITLRKDRLAAVIRAMREAGVPQLMVSHCHCLGAAVDPTDYRMSMEEESAYTEKARLELICEDDAVAEIVDIVRSHAATGQQGDGLIVIRDVERIVKIRTGDENALALV